MARDSVDQGAARSTGAQRAERAYRAALERLIAGKATYPDHAGRPVRITPAAVAREAGRSRNPLYTTHRELLAEIEVATKGPTPAADLAATIARLEAEIAELRAAARQHAQEKRALATENLALLHRARAAEERVAARDRENAELRRRAGRLVAA
jgi:hypothetical protein